VVAVTVLGSMVTLAALFPGGLQLADADGVRLTRVPTIYVGDVLTFTGSKVAFEEEPD